VSVTTLRLVSLIQLVAGGGNEQAMLHQSLAASCD
jgi:hypothetical protein